MNYDRREHVLRTVDQVVKKLSLQVEASLDRQVTELDLLPRDLRAIANLLGLKVKSVDEDELDSGRAPETLGAFDRERKEILIATGKLHTRQRFTLAHELGHYLLHNQLVSFREDFASNETGDNHLKPEIEQEADLFAAELVMPTQPVRRVFVTNFDSPIDGAAASDDIAYFLSQRPHRKFSASEIVRLGPLGRAKLFARIGSYAGVPFKPMCEVFDVSVQAMANRLIDLGLVK